MDTSSQKLIDGIKHGDLAAFEELYRQYYTFLCLIAQHIIRNSSEAEEIVTDVFVKLWTIREKIDITTSLKAYLIKAVRNTSLNYIKRSGLNNKMTDSLNNINYEILAWESDYPLGQLYKQEIMDILNRSVSELPDSCREIFLLSRDKDLKYFEIACRLGISVNTVKAQMKIALARLRKCLRDYLALLLLLAVL